MKKYEPQDWSYKMRPHKLTPEEEATLARWRQEIRARARARLRERQER